MALNLHLILHTALQTLSYDPNASHDFNAGNPRSIRKSKNPIVIPTVRDEARKAKQTKPEGYNNGLNACLSCLLSACRRTDVLAKKNG